MDADRGQRLAHLIQLEWFDDRDDEFHGQAFIVSRFPHRPPRSGDLPFPGRFLRLLTLASFWAIGTKKLQVEGENVGCR
jgi:hypothetical protein